MHVKLQTWFPFLIQVYINGREMMKHVFDENGITYKMYDKFSCLRVEMTINDPREFKVYKDVRHQDGTVSKRWVPMGKAISNLYRYAEVSKAANRRFLDSLRNIVPAGSIEREINEVCGKKTVRGKPSPVTMSGQKKPCSCLRQFRMGNISSAALQIRIYGPFCTPKSILKRRCVEK